MASALALVAVLIAACYLLKRAEPFVNRWLAIQEARAAQLRAEAEQSHALKVVEHEASKKEPAQWRDPPPVGLLNLALAESEPWAREDALKRMWELYEESGDWDRVAHAMSLQVGE